MYGKLPIYTRCPACHPGADDVRERVRKRLVAREARWADEAVRCGLRHRAAASEDCGFLAPVVKGERKERG